MQEKLFSDPNIPVTGEQATRALHSSDERECCFHVCSEKELDLGICANCTDREPRKRGKERDPPTAPHCEITPIQSGSAGMSMSSISSPHVDVINSTTNRPNLSSLICHTILFSCFHIINIMNRHTENSFISRY